MHRYIQQNGFDALGVDLSCDTTDYRTSATVASAVLLRRSDAASMIDGHRVLADGTGLRVNRSRWPAPSALNPPVIDRAFNVSSRVETT
jgi:hypothetical protein